MNEKYLGQHHVLFLIFFAFVSWFFFSGLFLDQTIMNFLYGLYSNENHLSKSFDERDVKVIISNPKTNEKEKIEPKEELYRSDRNAEARGKLTRRKGFQWLSEQDELKNIHKYKNQKQSKEEILTARIIHEKKLLWKNFKKKRKYSQLSKIPDSYQFDYKHAFSWSRDGSLQIPSYHYKHYQYIKSMLNKIRYHWSPPGGSPRNLYQYDYHSNYYVPGNISIQVFPPQNIGLVFMLDESGEVMDVKIKYSMGYESLNESFIQAIRSVGNFGPPPKDFLRLNQAIFPWLFKLY